MPLCFFLSCCLVGLLVSFVVLFLFCRVLFRGFVVLSFCCLCVFVCLCACVLAFWCFVVLFVCSFVCLVVFCLCDCLLVCFCVFYVDRLFVCSFFVGLLV